MTSRPGAWAIALTAAAGAALAGVAWRLRAPRTAADTRLGLAALAPKPSDLNVVVITLDTTRADRLGCYGFSGVQTPHIDALARKGVLFERAAATVPLTFPSHSSIFTGLVPPHHGVRDNGGFFLDPAHVTLAERLREAGWTTGAFVGAWVLESKWGLGQGFDEYSDRFQLSKYKVVSLGTVQKPGEEVAADAVRWIDGVKDRKFFAWVHLYDPHTPYDPPEPFASRHPQRPYLGEIEYADSMVGKLMGAPTRNVYKANSGRAEPLRLRLEELARTRPGAAVERRALDPDTLQRLAALGYVGNVVDADPSAVLADPKSTLPVFQSLSAAKDLAQQDRLEDAVARIRGVLASEPGMMDAQITLGTWLTRLRRPDEAAEAFKAALNLKPDDDVALQNLAHVYITRGRNRDALEALEVFRAALRMNPKNQQSWYQLATLYMDLGRTADAQAAFEEALAANPRMGAAYNGLGVLAFEAGDAVRAQELFSKVVSLEPDLRTAHYNLARLREARKDAAQAEALYRQELEIYPDNGKARFNLAQIYRSRGDRARYLAELEAAVDQAPDFGPSYFFLAREHLALGRLDSAAEIASRGLKMAGGSDVAPLGHYVLADVYNRQGRAADARSEVLRAQKPEAALRRNPQKQI